MCVSVSWFVHCRREVNCLLVSAVEAVHAALSLCPFRWPVQCVRRCVQKVSAPKCTMSHIVCSSPTSPPSPASPPPASSRSSLQSRQWTLVGANTSLTRLSVQFGSLFVGNHHHHYHRQQYRLHLSSSFPRAVTNSVTDLVNRCHRHHCICTTAIIDLSNYRTLVWRSSAPLPVT